MQVLVADDSKPTRALLQDILEQDGYEVISCAEGTAAWDVISTGKCSLAVLDWQMPGMSGIEICRKIRDFKSNGLVYAIVLTALDQPQYVIEAFKSGASDHVGKPFRKEELLARIGVGARLVSLQAELAQAQRLESVGQLAAGIAHEINTPIQYVSHNTRFLKDAMEDVRVAYETLQNHLNAAHGGESTEATVSILEGVLKELDAEYLIEEIPRAIDESLTGLGSVAEIVLAMKEFSHPGTTVKNAVDLRSAIETTITVARNEWKYVADLETDFDPDLPHVSCLPGELNQVFLNLIVNAAHAIEGALSDGHAEKGVITVGTRRNGQWAEIFVGDTGTGIAKEHQARVFDPFYTTKEVGKGTGQGLAIAHSVVVDKHGGSIRFDSEPGKGTTFIIRLPIHGDRQ